MRLGKSLGLASGLLFATAISASAISLNPVAADCDPALGDVIGGITACGNTAAKRDAGNVNAGAGDNAFFSLGLGGGIIIQVTPDFTGGGTIVEVTNSGSDHAEQADVYVGTTDVLTDMTYVGTVNNGVIGAEVTSVTAGVGPWSYIALVDNSAALSAASINGYDLDAISLTPVPVPASVLLLGAAIAGLGALRRKA